MSQTSSLHGPQHGHLPLAGGLALATQMSQRTVHAVNYGADSIGVRTHLRTKVKPRKNTSDGYGSVRPPVSRKVACCF